MKKNIISLLTLLAVAGGSFVATSCKDADSVQDMKLSQVLSATNLTMEANADLSVTVSWSQMFNADEYELVVSQDPTFADESLVAYSGKISQAYTKGAYCTVTVKNLDPETTYYGRVQAFNADETIADSKYVYAEVTTVAEQILDVIDKGNITSNSVVITWTEGEYVEAVELINSNGEVEKTVTPTEAEIADGEMTIDGLNSHAGYTVRLVSKTGKTRGTRMFTTLLDLSNATLIAEGDDWESMVEGASAGAVFAFAPGNYTASGAVVISSDVVLAAQDITDMPTLHCQFQIDNNASLYCYYVGISADDATLFTDQCFNFKSTGKTASLNVECCEVYGYAKGLVYINTATVVNEINITGCYIHDIPCNGGDFIDSRSGSWNTLNFNDNTVVNSFIARDFLRSPKSAVSTGISNVENNTFYNCGSGGASYRLFYTQITNAVNTFKNNVMAGFKNTRGFCNGNYGTINTSGNVYFECENLTELADGNTQAITFFDENGTVLSSTPFTDAENGDFSLADANLRLKKVGASKWYE